MFKILLSSLLIAGSLAYAQDNEPKKAEEILKEKYPSYFDQELEKAATEGDSRFYEEFLTMLFYLGLIIIFLLVAAWFLKRAQTAKASQLNQTSAIKIIDARALTAKTNIYVLGIHDKIITIADSVNGVSLLSEHPLYKSEETFEKLMREKNKS